MIKNLKEWRKYSSKLLDENITAKKTAEIKAVMNEFERANPEIFRKLRDEKWSSKGLRIVHPDGSVTIL